MIASCPFSIYKTRVDESIQESIASFGPKTRLRDAIEYALASGGKRFRPALVYIIAKTIGDQDVTDAALAVEFFHTASLIADDLPCMDDDALRRERPTVHKLFGEATALLATYALIASAYDRIRLCGQQVSGDVSLLALQTATFNTGIFGATGGQFLDLFAHSPTSETAKEIIMCKTAALFEISFVFGWLFGGGDPALLNLIKKMAHHFGVAFQIGDDLIDLKEDKKRFNYPALVGVEVAKEELQEELAQLKQLLKEVGLDSSELAFLLTMVERRATPR